MWPSLLCNVESSGILEGVASLEALQCPGSKGGGNGAALASVRGVPQSRISHLTEGTEPMSAIKMFRGSWLVFLVFFGAPRLFGGEVDEATARRVAANWLSERASRTVAESALQIRSAPEGMHAYAVTGGGWILVAADDRARPVLGYSLTGTYGRETMPETCRDWLQSLSQSVTTPVTRGETNPVVLEMWSRYDCEAAEFQQNLPATQRVSEPAVNPTAGPLIQTTLGQGTYYNAQCPLDADGPDGHVLTGCVPTALAQIMIYHQYPASGYGSHSYTHETYGTLSADFGSTAYDWAAMPASGSLCGYNSELARLLFQAGVSVEIDYGPTGSSSLVGDALAALVDYFRYRPDSRLLEKDEYSDAEWDGILQAEIAAGRPMIYDSPGHAFICDGYDSSSPALYHFNWGWGGTSDGFYALSSLTPESYDFTEGQRVAVGIQPEGEVSLSPPYEQSFESADLPENWFAAADDVAIYSGAAAAGTQSLMLGSISDVTYLESSVQVKIAVPVGGAAATFQCQRSGTCESPYDSFTCQVREPYGDEVLSTIFAGAAHDADWQTWSVDLLPYAGQDVVLYFELVSCTESNAAWMLLDDFKLGVSTVPGFQAERSTWFANRPLRFANRSVNSLTYSWSFEGGIPATSTEQNPPPVTYASPGTYDVALSVTNANGTEIKTEADYVTILAEPSMPYLADFEADDAGFFACSISGSETPQWEWGACSTTNFSGDYASIAGDRGWATVLASHHGFWCQYAVESPPFSFASPGNYILSFDYRAATGADAGFNLEISTDSGSSWSLLGCQGDALGTDWYNTASIAGLDAQAGWTGYSFDVVSPTYDLSAYAGVDDLRVRFVMGTEGSASDGVQIDNFAIAFTAQSFENAAPEFALASVEFPVSGGLAAGGSGWSDVNGDAEGYRYQWKINGEALAGETGATLATGCYASGDTITCEVTAWDGLTAGNTHETTPVAALGLRDGWNLVSLPVNPSETDPARLLRDPLTDEPCFLGSIWAWDGSRYLAASLLEAGQGYWLYCQTPPAELLLIPGMAVTNCEFDLRPGWNLLGPVGRKKYCLLEGVLPAGLIYGWSGDHVYMAPANNRLCKACGYWLYSAAAGCLDLETDSNVE
jgi:PKD repeat protein